MGDGGRHLAAVDVAIVDLGAVLELPASVAFVLQVIDGTGCDFHR